MDYRNNNVVLLITNSTLYKSVGWCLDKLNLTLLFYLSIPLNYSP